MKLHSNLLSLLVVYNTLSITLCGLTTGVIEMCDNIGVVYRYYEHTKFETCVIVMNEVMQNTDKDTILRDIRAIEQHVGKETALKAYKLFRSNYWSGPSIEYLLTGLGKTKELDHFSKFDIIKLALDLGQQCWTALLSDRFLGFFHLFSVLDCILQKKEYLSYVVQYHNWLLNGPTTFRVTGVCDTYVAMDIFTFLIQYSQGTNVHFRQPDDSYDFFRIICDRTNGWTGENLYATFVRQEVQQLDKTSLKIYLKHIKEIPQMQQNGGSLYGWSIGLVVKQITKCGGDEDLAVFCLRVISRAPNILTPDLVDIIVLKIIARKINQSYTELQKHLDGLTLLSQLFVETGFTLSADDALNFPDFVLRSVVFIKRWEAYAGNNNGVITFRSLFKTARSKSCTVAQMLRKLDSYDNLYELFRYQVPMFRVFGNRSCYY